RPSAATSETSALPDKLEACPALPLFCDPVAGLDSDQRAAVEVTGGPLLIIAGPGTGKTRTLTHRIAYLLTQRGVAPHQILSVTFTTRAGKEMGERLEKLAPASSARLWVTTFHGLGYRILREQGAPLGLPPSGRIATEAERKALLVENL